MQAVNRVRPVALVHKVRQLIGIPEYTPLCPVAQDNRKLDIPLTGRLVGQPQLHTL